MSRWIATTIGGTAVLLGTTIDASFGEDTLTLVDADGAELISFAEAG